MPIIWRYFITHFLSISIATVMAFIAILLTMRLDEIAHYASLGAPVGGLLIFTFHQIFYILPVAIPLSCLISSFILFQRLSKAHELTSLRSCGFSFKDILTPVMLTAAFLGLLNFWVISELSTNSHLQTNLLKSELRSMNPLLLLHNRNLMRMKGFYLDTLGTSRIGEYATDVILAIPSKHQKRLNLFVAKKVSSTHSTFNGKGVTLINSIGRNQEDDFDDLLIENIDETLNQVNDFSQLLQKKVWTINNDYLQLPLLLVRAQEQRLALEQGKANKIDKLEIKRLKGQLNRSLSEITKRLSIAFAVLTFTFMGSAFGISISRQQSRKNLCMAIALTTLYLVSFFLGRGVEQNFLFANLLYLLPHGIILLASAYVLSRATRGVE